MRRTTDSVGQGVMTEAILRAGLVTENQLAEMKRWKSPSIDPEATVEELKPLEEAAELVADALQSEGYVLMRETDLEVVRQYIETSRRGSLYVLAGDGPGEQTEFEVTYGKTSIGEYILAWRSESIKDLMTNGLTFLMDGPTQVFFKDVRELFFGKEKTFMVCVPAEAHDNAG